MLAISRAAVIAGVVFFVFCLFSVINARSVPRLSVGASPKLNFGSRKSGEQVFVPVKLTNVGGGELVVQSAKSSCGCTTVDCPTFGRPIASAASADMVVKVSGAGITGSFSVAISIRSNDPISPDHVVYIEGVFGG